MTTIKFSKDAKCPHCGGMLSYDARMSDKLPLGFGFVPGSASFQVDLVERKGWRGECMECSKQVFAVQSRRHVTKHPASINRKLAAMCR